MKELLEKINVSIDILYPFTISKLEDEFTMIPRDFQKCILFLDSINIKGNDLISQVLEYALFFDNAVEVKTSVSPNITKTLFYRSIEKEYVNLVDFNNIVYSVHLSEIVYCHFQ